MARFKERYVELKSSWAGYAGYDAWVARSNNAALAGLAEYEDLVPAFEALFKRAGSWALFYDEVRKLARLPQPERLALLNGLVDQGAPSGMVALP